jgi:hypothetical protein
MSERHTVTLGLDEVPEPILRRELAKAERLAQNPHWLNVLWPARAECALEAVLLDPTTDGGDCA